MSFLRLSFMCLFLATVTIRKREFLFIEVGHGMLYCILYCILYFVGFLSDTDGNLTNTSCLGNTVAISFFFMFYCLLHCDSVTLGHVCCPPKKLTKKWTTWQKNNKGSRKWERVLLITSLNKLDVVEFNYDQMRYKALWVWDLHAVTS